MKKIFLIGFLFFLSISTMSLAKQSMISLKDYINKNNVNETAVQSYVFNRCAAVSLYVSSLFQHYQDKSLSVKAEKNYKFFSEANFIHLTNKGNMTAESASKNFDENVPSMTKIYFNDGQNNFLQSGEYTTGYIIEDFQICDNFLKLK